MELEGNEVVQNEVVETNNVVEATPEATPEKSAIDALKEKAEAFNEKSEEPTEEKQEEKAAAPETPAYTPNFKVSSYGKEYEIPELYRSLIKDKASEEEVRKLFAKAYGFEGMEPKYRSLQETHKAISTEHTNLTGEIGRLSNYVKLRDYDAFFEALQIPEENIKAWMLEKLQRSQLPPEQQAVYNREQQLRREFYNKQENEQRLSSELQTKEAAILENQTKELQVNFDRAMSSPETAALAQKIDAAQGENYFRNYILEKGSQHFDKTGEIVPVDQLVSEATAYFGKFFAQVAAPQAAAPVRGQATVEAQKSKAVIPNTGGSTSSPVKKKITNFNDLRKVQEDFLNDRV